MYSKKFKLNMIKDVLKLEIKNYKVEASGDIYKKDRYGEFNSEEWIYLCSIGTYKNKRDFLIDHLFNSYYNC